MAVVMCTGRPFKVSDGVSLALQYPLRRHETLFTHGTSSVDPTGADTDLCPQSEPVAVRESCTGIVEDAGTVNSTQELASSFSWREEGETNILGFKYTETAYSHTPHTRQILCSSVEDTRDHAIAKQHHSSPSSVMMQSVCPLP